MNAHTMHAARVSTRNPIPAQVIDQKDVSDMHLVSSEDTVLARLAADVLHAQAGDTGGIDAPISAHSAVLDGHVCVRGRSFNGSFKPSGGFDEQKAIEVQHNIGSVDQNGRPE